ncbi:MAG: hypothetical protein CM15mP128_4790 [Methanobacteriota archaeon]|nr:MAG: hypothetical protein CM15mP128_4790 [Euryarchaeota archaeon]
MPSHIDAWVGQWKEAIECNIAAVEADDHYVSVTGNESQFYKFYRMHNHHFIVWCAKAFDGQVRDGAEVRPQGGRHAARWRRRPRCAVHARRHHPDGRHLPGSPTSRCRGT